MNREELTNNYYIISKVSGEVLASTDNPVEADHFLSHFSVVEALKLMDYSIDPWNCYGILCELLTRDEMIKRIGEEND